jgi:O-antigen/teichoic acid export membrane protein
MAAVLSEPERPLARIAHMTAAFAGSDFLRGAIGLATSLVIARGLGRDDFGLWVLCLAWTSTLCVLFDLGFGVLLTREAARGVSAMGPLLVNALIARVALFLPVAVYVVLGAPGMGVGRLSPEMLRAIAGLAAAGIAYACMAAVYRVSPRRLLFIAAIETAGAAAQCVATVFVVRGGGTIVDLLHLAVLVQVAQFLAAIAVWRLIAPQDRFEPPTLRVAARLLRRGVPFTLTGLVANAQTRLAPLVLGYAGTAGELASFGVAARMEGIARRLPHAALGSALPVFSHAAVHRAAGTERARFDRALLWFATAAALAILAGRTPIVRLTYGVEFLDATSPLLWAGLGLVPSLVNSARKVHLYAAGDERVALRWSAATLAVKVVACAVLAPAFGAAGAMAALAIGEAAIWWPLRRAEAAAAGARS